MLIKKKSFSELNLCYWKSGFNTSVCFCLLQHKARMINRAHNLLGYETKFKIIPRLFSDVVVKSIKCLIPINKVDTDSAWLMKAALS